MFKKLVYLLLSWVFLGAAKINHFDMSSYRCSFCHPQVHFRLYEPIQGLESIQFALNPPKYQFIYFLNYDSDTRMFSLLNTITEDYESILLARNAIPTNCFETLMFDDLGVAIKLNSKFNKKISISNILTFY